MMMWARMNELFPIYRKEMEAQGFAPWPSNAIVTARECDFQVFYPVVGTAVHVCEEPFTYIDRVAADREEFQRWLDQRQGQVAILKEATQHMWFQAYCMLNRVSIENFLDPALAPGMVHHWQSWVAEQEA